MEDKTNRAYPREQVDRLCEILTGFPDRVKALHDRVLDRPVNADSHFSAMIETQQAFDGVEQAIISLTELGISSTTIARLKDWRDHFMGFYCRLFVSDVAQEHPESMTETYGTLGGFLSPGATEKEHKHIQTVRRRWGDNDLNDFRDFTTGFVDYLTSLPTTPSGEPATSSTGRRWKQRHDAGGKLKKGAQRDVVFNFIRDKCGGRWDGTLEKLSETLKQKTGLQVSAPTLSRYLEGTDYYQPGKPHRAAKGKRQREGVSDEAAPDDLSDVDAWTMPDDDPIS